MANLIHSRRVDKRHSKFEAVSGSATRMRHQALPADVALFSSSMVTRNQRRRLRSRGAATRGWPRR
jgi:hypothetical protein